jgi:hypothetical protein
MVAVVGQLLESVQACSLHVSHRPSLCGASCAFSHTCMRCLLRVWLTASWPACVSCLPVVCACSLSVFYSRSSSRASSGELSRQSWGSMRGLSLGHGPHILGGSGGGAGMASPSGSLGRVGANAAELMAAAAAGKCSSLHTQHSSTCSSRPRSGQQRPISTAAVLSPPGAAVAAAAPGGASPAAAAPVSSASQLAAGATL